MLRRNNRCVESLNISVECHQNNVENIHKFTQYTDYVSITQECTSSCLNNLFMVSFKLIRMLSYAKNNLATTDVLSHSTSV